MHYMPAQNSGVYFPPTPLEPTRIRPFSFHVLKECMEPEVGDKVLAGYFPGRTFYGALFNPASASEMRHSLGILRAVRSAHGLLGCIDALLEEEDGAAAEQAKKIIGMMIEAEGVEIELGEGYSDELNPENSIPQCHILHCEIVMPDNYFNWLRRRAGAYEGMMQLFHAEPVLFLNMRNRIIFSRGEEGGKAIIDVYGTQSLLSDWDVWFDKHRADLTLPGPAGIEVLAGLLHLADTIATMHLVTSAPTVERGEFCRSTAGDSLTDFWVKVYDPVDDGGYTVGNCEVCGRMFIGASRAKRGHKDCLNRRRVKLSRAKKYISLVESGVSVREASRQASISEESAVNVLAENRLRVQGERGI